MPIILNLHKFSGDINGDKELIIEENIKPVSSCIFYNDTISDITEEFFSFSPIKDASNIGVFLSKLKSGHIIELSFKSAGDKDAIGASRQFLDYWYSDKSYTFLAHIVLANTFFSPIETYFCNKLLDYSVTDNFEVYLKVSEIM